MRSVASPINSCCPSLIAVLLIASFVAVLTAVPDQFGPYLSLGPPVAVHIGLAFPSVLLSSPLYSIASPIGPHFVAYPIPYTYFHSLVSFLFPLYGTQNLTKRKLKTNLISCLSSQKMNTTNRASDAR
jgi:hypothetical protein